MVTFRLAQLAKCAARLTKRTARLIKSAIDQMRLTRLCGCADVATGKIWRKMRINIRIIPTLLTATIDLSWSCLLIGWDRLCLNCIIVVTFLFIRHLLFVIKMWLMGYKVFFCTCEQKWKWARLPYRYTTEIVHFAYQTVLYTP